MTPYPAFNEKIISVYFQIIFSACKDALSDCAAYGKKSCSGVYESWARKNCKLFCNYCGGMVNLEEEKGYQ